MADETTSGAPSAPENGAPSAGQVQKTSMNPQQEALAANRKQAGVVPQVQKPGTGIAPKKIGKEKQQQSRKKFLIGCAGAFLFLFVIFIVLMVLMISQTGSANPVMQSFGLDPSGLRSFLLGVVGFSFGLLALFFMVLMVIGLFRMVNAPKTDKEAKRRGVRMTVFSLLPFVFILVIWFLLYSFIFRIQIAAERVIAEIVVLEPADLEGLTAPVEITFTAENVATALQNGGFSIQSMDWDLDGDGTYETPVRQAEITQLYTRRGNYLVGLQVGVVGEEEFRVYEKPIFIEEATFKADPASGTAPLTVQFDAGILIPPQLKIKSLDWDFQNDGAYDLEGKDNIRTRFTFDKIGTYRVHLRVVNEQNNVENYYRDVNVVLSDTPLLNAQIDTSPGLAGVIPFQVRFDGSESRSLKGTITRYDWDFGNGSKIQSGKNVTYTFDKPGLYRVTLTVRDDVGNVASSSVDIDVSSVSSIPQAVIATSPLAEGDILKGVLPFKVEFDASKSTDLDEDIVEYSWDFNGDSKADEEGKTVTHTFEEAGTYAVGLKVVDSEGQTSSSTLDVVVTEPGIQAVIKADPEEGTAPLVVQFDGSSSSTFVGRIVSYEWDFGDESPKTITGASVSHKYEQVGTYNVTLKVLTNQGQSASISQAIYVREIPLRACFEPSRSNGSAPLTVSFDTKCSTGGVSDYKWAFGDGDESESRQPSHTFEHPGAYTVTLEVSDDKNNVDTYSEVIVAEGEVQ